MTIRASPPSQVKADFYNCSRWFRGRFHGNHSPIIYSEGCLVSVSDKQNLVLVLYYELLLNWLRK